MSMYIPPMPSTASDAAAEPSEQHDRTGWASNTSLFASRVSLVFATRMAQFAMGFVTVFLIARILGDKSSGQYALLQTWVLMLFAIGQLGMPAAMTFMAGRGKSLVSLERTGLWLTVTVSAVISIAAIAAVPILQGSLLKALGGSDVSTSDDLLRLVLMVVPCQFMTQFAAGILYTRGHNQFFNRIQVLQAASLLLLTLILIGFFPFGVTGAVMAYLVTSVGGAIAAGYEVHRLARLPDGALGEACSIREFTRYGIRLYPQNVTSFFSYRADVFLLSWLLADPRVIAYYIIAVRIAEMTFYVPDSISAMLYPAISASDKHAADRFAPGVARLTILGTFLLALAIVPAGIGAVWVLLQPEFRAAFPALLVIMPGILSLSLSKILASYISGLGRPTPTAVAAIIALVLNLAANLILIPRWGIVGASAASLISYTCHATMLLFVASRWAGVSPLAFIVPRRAEFERIWRVFVGVVATVRSQAAQRGHGPSGG
jgi:O-antigen/teichoic acid export membrane protein